MSNLAPGLSIGDLPGFRPEDDFDDDAFQEWAEDKAYDDIKDMLSEYISEKSEEIAEKLLEGTIKNEPDLFDKNKINEVFVWSTYVKNSIDLHLIDFLSEVYVEDNQDELMEEYLESEK